jgi:hypothetical protein
MNPLHNIIMSLSDLSGVPTPGIDQFFKILQIYQGFINCEQIKLLKSVFFFSDLLEAPTSGTDLIS